VQPHVKTIVESVDAGLGKIVTTLKDLKLDENTLLIFTSDNGGYIHYNHEFLNISSNGVLRGQKAEVYEGGHRVPFIARWPGKIKPGSVSEQTIMSMDLFPTFAEIAGISLSDEQPVDGVDLSGVLFQNEKLTVRTLFWKMGDEVAVRKGPWKLVKIDDHPVELYNLKTDLSESYNVAGSKKDLVASLRNEYELWLSKMEASSIQWN
jgi:arylsulfatase A-like enzyme